MHSKSDFSKFNGNAFDALAKSPIAKGIYTMDQFAIVEEPPEEEKEE